MLINIREFQIITYLGHQLYTFLDVCYIEGEFVDIVWHRDTYRYNTRKASESTRFADMFSKSIGICDYKAVKAL